jgi:hypothetical protein
MSKATYGTGNLIKRGKKWYGYPRIAKKDPVTGGKVIDRKPIILGSTSKLTKTAARPLCQHR